MVAILLYFCLWKNRKGGYKPGESVNSVARYLDYNPYYNYTICGGAYYSYCTTDLGTSNTAKDVIVSICQPGHQRVIFPQKNPVNFARKQAS